MKTLSSGATLHRRSLQWLALCLLLCLCSLSASAQWRGDGTQETDGAIPFTPLTFVPEYHTDMSLDCFIGYVAMDSIAHLYESEAIRNHARHLSTDSLLFAARILYSIDDYDPFLRYRYILATNQIMTYPGNPVDVYTSISHELHNYRKVGRTTSMLMTAEYVMRVKVTDVVVGNDTTFHEPNPITNVACEILEVFKGHRFPGNCTFPAARASGTTAGNCLIFNFRTDGATGPHDQEHSDDRVYYGWYGKPEVGKEYIVFLQLCMITNPLCNLVLMREFEATGGMFKIENGRVNDPSNAWGAGTNPTLDDFRQKILDKIQAIKSYTLH